MVDQSVARTLERSKKIGAKREEQSIVIILDQSEKIERIRQRSEEQVD